MEVRSSTEMGAPGASHSVLFTTAKAGVSRVVSQTRIIASGFTGLQYDVAPDGRFLVNSLKGDAAPLTLMTGWTARLQR